MSGNGCKDRGHSNNSFLAMWGIRGISPNSTNEPCYRTPLIPIDMPIVIGVVGSNNQGAISQQTGMGDPLVVIMDLRTIALRVQMQSQPFNAFSLPLIRRDEEKFADKKTPPHMYSSLLGEFGSPVVPVQ
ncbi:unnamed protein product [Lactuca saligna]|uniref:Uncharacterized protein n=1 Tax=Lactuca saligna TaxID=75948 RepID=A0AA35YTZ2_LACSI|nr:unnamed protein product [Lactuca saligna]